MPANRLDFGLSVVPYAADHARIIDQVLAAERGGLDLVGIQDHPYQRRYLDTFSLIADLLARTERLRFFPDVANLGMRPPPMLAKAAVSLDVMSGGRFELGLGAGGFWQAVAGMGGPDRAPGERLAALDEAIRLLRAVFDGERVVRGPGPHYPVPGYPPGPPPAHRIEIWVGAMHRRTLDLIGRAADGWIPGRGITRRGRFAELNERIDAAAAAAGRDPRQIRRIYNVAGTITDGGRAEGPLHGPPELWIETLADWAGQWPVDAYVYWPPDVDPSHVERFAADVVPALRSAISR